METTFMTIHNLSPEANILYASDSIVDVLGYHPHEVINRSCFDYFHPNEVPFARAEHDRGIKMDKAAALYYARIQNRGQQWVSCECVFTIVHDVLVACTSIYRDTEKNRSRAQAAPTVQQRFALPPHDPRYHMLEHLSAKFRAPPQSALNEPRAALILNRFTRTLTVMYATNSVQNILGIPAEDFKNKSFYECISENCLPDAIRCLESAKANDSIAYLRFWYRNPLRREDVENDQALHDDSQSSDSDEGGVELHDHMEVETAHAGAGGSDSLGRSGQTSAQAYSSGSAREASGVGQIHHNRSPPTPEHSNSSGQSSTVSNNAVFDQTQGSRSSTSSIPGPASARQRRTPHPQQADAPAEYFELEAVVSCTSDGLVLVLRRARSVPQEPPEPAAAVQAARPNGLFAAPWGPDAIRPHVYQPDQNSPFRHAIDAPLVPPGGPPMEDFMASIRDIAVFAWSLVGINGNIVEYKRGGTPGDEALPPNGPPVWDPYGQPSPVYYEPPYNQALERWSQRDAKRAHDMGIHSRVPAQRYDDDNMHGMGCAPNQPMDGMAPAHAQHNNPGLQDYAYQGPGNFTNNGYAGRYGQPEVQPQPQSYGGGCQYGQQTQNAHPSQSHQQTQDYQGHPSQNPDAEERQDIPPRNRWMWY
ncbi:hypothetical protein BJ878DRAFT_299614 [Calycina marina]|uniref:PAS domain-containing protein n=1 Tax=Calycina marina TaxID=1763456 RepID=A0A9P7YV57_9HELO|nr:hypothetical protein BJ878DRAFT_299614 [Calycina marina]